MTERKPPGLSFESWIDKQIRDAEERGEFDNLPGKGKPLPDIDKPRDELWWVRQKLKREDVDILPPTLQIRRDLDEAREKIRRATTEGEVREIVTAINEKIRHVNSHVVSGPPTTVAPLHEETVVDRWRNALA
ncbi:MAG TPA: DUF1992 domain-containing protein [Acidimicrobiales bacterium]|nr:DUF1992 domain-containing protein [Acidimicrobiales bacterium]